MKKENDYEALGKVPWYRKGFAPYEKVTLWGVSLRYVLLVALLFLSVGPFVWQLSTSFKSGAEDVYSFPPRLIPGSPTFENYFEVARTIPILNYGLHSLIVALVTVATNAFFCTLAGYALATMKFRFKILILVLFFSTLLLPGEVTMTSQYLTIKSLGFSNSLVGVILPGAIAAMNVLLMTVACKMIPKEILEAAIIDGTSTWQRLRYIVWPNVRGMVSVVALFSFIGAWDDFLWPLIVLSDPEKYTLTVGMAYLQSNFGANPRVVAAGTVIALVPIILIFATLQKHFFKGVEEGAVKG